MTRLRTLCLLAVSIAIVNGALASGASAENALPATLALPTEVAGEVSLTGSSTTAKTKIVGIKTLEGTGYAIELFAEKDMVNRGVEHLTLTKVKLGTEECETSGAQKGEVIVNKAEWKSVSRLPSGWAMLTALPPATEIVTIECPGGIKIKVKGNQLSKAITALNTEVLTTGTFEIETGNCTGKTPAWFEYDTDPAMNNAKLESSEGLGFEETCLQIEGNIKLKPSKMLEFM